MLHTSLFVAYCKQDKLLPVSACCHHVVSFMNYETSLTRRENSVPFLLLTAHQATKYRQHCFLIMASENSVYKVSRTQCFGNTVRSVTQSRFIGSPFAFSRSSISLFCFVATCTVLPVSSIASEMEIESGIRMRLSDCSFPYFEVGLGFHGQYQFNHRFELGCCCLQNICCQYSTLFDFEVYYRL